MEKHFEKLRELKKIKNEEEFWRAEKIFKNKTERRKIRWTFN